MNNITVDGSSFNSSFGVSASQPGDRTGVAPISLESIEQVQVNIAPYDVRQGSFIGAGVNTVTRSGGNRLSGSFFHRFRDQDWVGTEAKGQPFNPGTFKFRNTGGWASGPIVRNKWFVFGNYEDELDTRPLTTVAPRRGGEADHRQRDARAGVGSHHAQPVPGDELRLRDRPVQRPAGRDAGQAVPAAERLQPEQQPTRSASATTT